MTQSIVNIKKAGHQRRLWAITKAISTSKFFGNKKDTEIERARLNGYLQALEEEGLITHDDAFKVSEAY